MNSNQTCQYLPVTSPPIHQKKKYIYIFPNCSTFCDASRARLCVTSLCQSRQTFKMGWKEMDQWQHSWRDGPRLGRASTGFRNRPISPAGRQRAAANDAASRALDGTQAAPGQRPTRRIRRRTLAGQHHRRRLTRLNHSSVNIDEGGETLFFFTGGPKYRIGGVSSHTRHGPSMAQGPVCGPLSFL